MGKLAPNILKTAKVGKHTEDGGLQLRVTAVTSVGVRRGSWYFRYTFKGKQQEIGLGSIAKLNLKQARVERDRYADMMADRRNPVNPKEAKRQEREGAKPARQATLRDVTQLAFEARQGDLRGNGTAGRWMSPLTLYVLPVLGDMPVTDIHQNDIKQAMAGIWKAKPPTAQKALQRLGIVLQHARAMGLDVNPHVVSDARALLGSTGHVVRHHPALPPVQVPRLFQALDPQNVVQRALAFYILTGGGTRIKPVLALRYEHIDGDVWTVPAELMKGMRGKADDFRVPITKDMAKLIDISKAQAEPNDTLVFRSPNRSRAGEKGISDQAVENVMRRLQRDWGWAEPYRLHGLRASFRMWVSKVNPALYAVAETALAHKIDSLVERSYQRNDFLEERRALLNNWTGFLKTPCEEMSA